MSAPIRKEVIEASKNNPWFKGFYFFMFNNDGGDYGEYKKFDRVDFPSITSHSDLLAFIDDCMNNFKYFNRGSVTDQIKELIKDTSSLDLIDRHTIECFYYFGGYDDLGEELKNKFIDPLITSCINYKIKVDPNDTFMYSDQYCDYVNQARSFVVADLARAKAKCEKDEQRRKEREAEIEAEHKIKYDAICAEKEQKAKALNLILKYKEGFKDATKAKIDAIIKEHFPDKTYEDIDEVVKYINDRTESYYKVQYSVSKHTALLETIDFSGGGDTSSLDMDFPNVLEDFVKVIAVARRK